MKKEILTLVNSLREGTAGKTCMGTGNYSLDVITQREYPNGFVVGKRNNKFKEKVLTMEIGNTCGNVMTMLPYLGVKTFPVAFFDVSPHGYRMTRDMKAYGADVRFVSNSGYTGTTVFRCMHRLDIQGNHILKHKGSAAGKPWKVNAHASKKYISSKNGEIDTVLDKMDFTPDVFFFDKDQAGHRVLAERLRERGTLVYYEADSKWDHIEDEKKRMKDYRSFIRCVVPSDIVKMSGDHVRDLSFTDDYPDKLFIQTLSSEGLRFRLRGGEWIKLDPIPNPDYKDYEGAGDWTSSTLIAALCAKGMLKVKDMTEEAVKEVLMMAQMMASYSVGFIGSKGLIHADENFKFQDDTLEMPHYTKKLMYLHGSASAGYSHTSIGILKCIPEDWQLIMPDCPVDAEECLKMLKELCEKEKPDLIIGSSQGGYYAQMLKGYKRICVNPALEMSKDDDVKVGDNHEFLINRADGVQEYVITPEIQDGYRRLEAHQFEGITDFDRENCYGLFGDKDTDWGYCKPIFAEHYPHIHTFPGGHKMEYDEIENYLMPLVRELLTK